MQFNVQTALNYLLVALALVCGLVAGGVASRFFLMSLGSAHHSITPAVVTSSTARQLQEDDLQIILQRSLFDAAAIGSRLERINVAQTSLSEDDEFASSAASVDLEKYTLLGTVVAGEYSLALIQTGSEVQVYGVGSEIENGISLAEVERKLVVLLARGQRYELLLNEPQNAGQPAAVSRTTSRQSPRSSATASSTTTPQAGVVELGEGRYRVDRAMVEDARANMGTLLQSARMIPHLENDQTVGFRLVGMQRGSLLEQLGLRLGDVVMEINRIKLDSPEKALQIFQQVREANNISIGLVRDGQPETFEYSLD